MNPEYVIAIDIGSSYLKTAVLDLSQRCIAASWRAPSPPRAAHPDPRHFSCPAKQYVTAVKQSIAACVARFGRMAGILLCTQMHGFDYRTPGCADVYISWQDARCLNPLSPSGEGKSALECLQRLLSPEDMLPNGVALKPSLGLCNLYALIHGEGAAQGGELFTLGSYLTWQLTGRNLCHPQNAAPLGLLNVECRSWNREVLKRTGLDHIRLPKLAEDDFSPVGICRLSGQEIPLYPDFGDQQAAILGSDAGPGMAVVNAATAAQVSLETSDFRPGLYEIRPYFEGRYLRTISNMPGGRCLDVLVRFVQDAVRQTAGYEPTTGDVWRAVREGFCPNSRGLKTDLGFFDTPGHTGGGTITAITPENWTLQSLFAAALEEMARAYWKHIQLLDDKRPAAVVCAGGVSWKTPELLHALARTCGLPVRLSSLPDEVFAGLFRAGLVCTGRISGLSDRQDLKLLPQQAAAR